MYTTHPYIGYVLIHIPLHFTPCLRNPHKNLPHLSHHVNELKVCATKKCPPTSRFSVTHTHKHEIKFICFQLVSQVHTKNKRCLELYIYRVMITNICSSYYNAYVCFSLILQTSYGRRLVGLFIKEKMKLFVLIHCEII